MQAALRYRHQRDLLLELVARDLKVRYQRSMFGIGWSLMKPLLQLIVFSVVFNHVLPLGIPHYMTFVFAGVLAWSWFSSAILAAATAVTASRELVRRPGFPVVVLPLLPVLSQGIHFVMALPLLFIASTLDTGWQGAPLLALPIVIVLQFLLTAGLAYILAAAHVFFRDTEHFLTLTIGLGFYVTPVFYRPIQRGHDFSFLTHLNPVAWVLECYRAVLVDHGWPPMGQMVGILVVSLILLAIGILWFNRLSPRFDEVL